jgi:hypothetical protein
VLEDVVPKRVRVDTDHVVALGHNLDGASVTLVEVTVLTHLGDSVRELAVVHRGRVRAVHW